MHNIRLDYNKIIGTIKQLEERIDDRFPNSGLSGLCTDFLKIASETKQNIDYISKPLFHIRGLSFLVIAAGIFGLIYSFSFVKFDIANITFTDIVSIMEAAINDIVLIGAAIFFLVTFESRVKRSKAANSLNNLRTIAHVIDMHQLTKDPYMKFHDSKKAAHSPNRSLTTFELQRYLDYCSEMLSLNGKVAALYIQSFPDDIIVRQVNEIEQLCNDLSSKIWQKLIVLNNINQKEG